MITTMLILIYLFLFFVAGVYYKSYKETKKELDEMTKSRDYYKLRYERYTSLRGMRNTSLELPNDVKSVSKQEAIQIVTNKIMAICVNRPKNTQSKHYYYQNGLLDSLEYFCKLIAKIS